MELSKLLLLLLIGTFVNTEKIESNNVIVI